MEKRKIVFVNNLNWNTATNRRDVSVLQIDHSSLSTVKKLYPRYPDHLNIFKLISINTGIVVFINRFIIQN